LADTSIQRRPKWLVKRLPAHVETPVSGLLPSLLEDLKLNTVCRSARCPNLSECWAKRTATFMILGTNCTRKCRFCAVAHGEPEAVDTDEPARVAEAAKRLGLRFAVVTSVTRDDLPDGGAAHFAATVRAIHETDAKAEVLVPDFNGRASDVHAVIDSAPEVFGHNVETVPRLYETVRPGADYARSLRVLEEAASYGEGRPVVKSGLMLGLGETRDEVEQIMRDLASAGVRVLTLGQYLSPDSTRLPVAEYIAPRQFDEYAARAREFGFAGVSAGPFVRSSYEAAEIWRTATATTTSNHRDTEAQRTTEGNGNGC
jgi:lipoic acid synthetase